MFGIEAIIREKITVMAIGYGNLAATIKAHSDVWFHSTQTTMPGRCTLALIYEYFRIEKPVVNIMALQGIYNTDYRQFGDKALKGFWEHWKEVVRNVGNLVSVNTLTKKRCGA